MPQEEKPFTMSQFLTKSDLQEAQQKEKILTDGEILENRLIWIDALKNGGYKQCLHRMYDGASFCCLGIAKKVLTGQLPLSLEKDLEEVRNLLALSIGEQWDFIGLNSETKSFSEIADYAIEKWNLQKHFQEPRTEALESV